MSWIDITLIIIILLGIYNGYKEGFLLSLISLVAVVLGVLGGFKLMGYAMILLADKFNVNNVILPYISFGFVFIIIVVVVSLLARAVKASIDKSFLGRVDQVAGGLLGALKVTFMASIVIWIISSVKVSPDGKWGKESWLYPKVAAFAPYVTHWLAKLIPAFKNIF